MHFMALMAVITGSEFNLLLVRSLIKWWHSP